jgi:two-component system, sensor histidine kinase
VNPADSGADDGAMRLREQALRERETAVAERERTAALREGAGALREDAQLSVARGQARTEVRYSDLREANERLVIATLGARELKEAADDAHRRQDEFLAMLAHELRNPLAPIRSAAALLAKLPTSLPALARIRGVIERQVAHMARLLDDLLDASRVASGKVTLQRRPVAVAEFVDQAVETCRALIDAQQQLLTLDRQVAPLYVDGDPVRLAQIVGNLLHNAAKYTPPGGAIAVSARRRGETVEIRVSDNGMGIAADALPHVFDLFSQVERSLDRSQGGLGIGLTVVRGMAELHGGSIVASSRGLGQGSEFALTLPLIEHVVERRAAPHDEAAPDAPPLRLLLIDDNADAGAMLEMLLGIFGHEVATALTGARALELFPALRPQVVVCDIGLPGMNGYEFAARLRELAQGAMPLMIALTGYGTPEDRARALAAGFDHHLVKPVEPDHLLRLIAGASLAAATAASRTLTR